METAQKLLSVPMLEPIVQKAIAEAKDFGWHQVEIDARYKGLLAEFAGRQE